MLKLVKTKQFINKPEFEVLGIAYYSEDPEIKFTVYKTDEDLGDQIELRLGMYEHFKGGKYRIFGVATHEKTSEKFVFYQAFYDSAEFGNNAFWVRYLDNFLEMKSMGFVKIQKFVYIGEV